MKKYSLLLFYFVPWVVLGAKLILYLDTFALDGLAILLILISMFYMGALCFLAFQWGKRKKMMFWLLGSAVQYGVNALSGAPLLGTDDWIWVNAYGVLHILGAFLQVGMYFAGRREERRS